MKGRLSEYELGRIVAIECVSESLTEEEVRERLSAFGLILKIQFFVSGNGKRHAMVTFERPDEATQALDGEHHGLNVKPFNPVWSKRYEPPVGAQVSQGDYSPSSSDPSQSYSPPYISNPFTSAPEGWVSLPQHVSPPINGRENSMRSRIQKQEIEITNLNEEIDRLRDGRSQAWDHAKNITEQLRAATIANVQLQRENERLKLAYESCSRRLAMANNADITRRKDVGGKDDLSTELQRNMEERFRAALSKSMETTDRLNKELSHKSELLNGSARLLGEARREIARLKREKSVFSDDSTLHLDATRRIPEVDMTDAVLPNVGSGGVIMEEVTAKPEPSSEGPIPEPSITQDMLLKVGPALVQAFRQLDAIISTAMTASTDHNDGPSRKKRKMAIDYL
ncbi:hypothetical protein FRC17_008389 [Serendipita sp. 399]|nr:hypothetical protein FRC17_008389 [Serendipita sp. 399]